MSKDADTVSFDGPDETATAALDLPDIACSAADAFESQAQSGNVGNEGANVPLPDSGANTRVASLVNNATSATAAPLVADRAAEADRRTLHSSAAEIANRLESSFPAPPISPATDVVPIKPAHDIGPGSVLRDRYVIERVVGIGGNAVVFEAIDRHRDNAEESSERMALKALRPQLRSNPYALMRLRREFRQMQRLTHKGIARVFDLDCDGDTWFMTLELVGGQTITQWMKGPGTDAQAMQIITGCCEAVSYAHSHGIVHGDLKPSNVLITPSMDIKLVDFGSAAAENSGAAIAVSARSFAATPPYASPQILTGTLADPRDDVFSLACIAYAVLTRGGHPFERKSSLEAYREQMRPTYSPRIQPRVFDVIVRALSWQRANRHASASEFLGALIGNDLGREPVLRAERAILPTTSATTSALIAQYPMPPAIVCNVPVTLEVTPSRRYMLPSQWLTLQPWPDMGSGNATNHRLIPPPATAEMQPQDNEAWQWISPSLVLMEAPLIQVSHPQSATLEGELLIHPQGLQSAARRPQPLHPTIWHRHGLAAVAVIGVLAILLGHKSEVGSSTTQAQLPAVQAPVTTLAAASAATTEPVAIRETTGQPLASAEPNIIEHVVPPPPPVPAAPGFISFDSATVHVGSNQSMAVLNLKRLDSTRGRARIAWTVEGASARAVVDSKSIESQTIQFLDGQELRSLYIPLLTPEDPGEHQPTRTFTVKLKKLEGSPAIGPVTQTKVTIASGY